MITMSFTTRGAPVIVYGRSLSVVCCDQTSLPDPASSATSRPSIVPTKTLPFHTATPRFTTSQHAYLPHSRGTCGSYCHNNSPVFASCAYTALHEPVVNMTPSTTIGVPSRPRFVPVSQYHASPSSLTLLALI